MSRILNALNSDCSTVKNKGFLPEGFELMNERCSMFAIFQDITDTTVFYLNERSVSEIAQQNFEC